ncbi:hypothetical protein OG625_32595 [Streptomyces sp. NBC_01351]|uniref:hypothetical protein n=1 Tax=Streptomyces sp. NBC_01351 TaxID=2903833 RepID=UPI002E3170FF|nr:hypothetical protein [Streptomyces sp. NBC_01351]
MTTQQRYTAPWSGIAPAAETVGGAQILCVGLYTWLISLQQEPYNRGWGGGIALLFGLLVMAFVGPLLAGLLGFLHSFLFTTPVMVASNFAGLRTRLSAPYWAVPVMALIAAGYALPICLLADTSYVGTFTLIAGAGLLPVGVAVFARMRQLPSRTMRLWTVGPTAVALVAAFYLAATAPTYQPPVLERADYVGEWAGDGVRLQLGAQGEATVRRLPVHDGFEVVGHCSGHGKWTPTEAAYGSRAGVHLTIPTCGDDAQLSWEVAGTEEHPELFVLMGDPDDGMTAVLRKWVG